MGDIVVLASPQWRGNLPYRRLQTRLAETICAAGGLIEPIVESLNALPSSLASPVLAHATHRLGNARGELRRLSIAARSCGASTESIARDLLVVLALLRSVRTELSWILADREIGNRLSGWMQ